MSSMPWVKLYTEMLDDAKIGRLQDAVKWRFVSLVLLAGECDQDGALIISDKPMSIDDIAWRMRITREQCETEIETLLMCGVISLDDDLYYLPKFSDRQGRPQSERRAMWRERQARLRERKETDESVTRESPVTNASRVEKSREEKSRSRASKTPTPPQVESYRKAAHRYPNKSLYSIICEHVKDDEQSLLLFEKIVTGWIAMGWNPSNINGILEFVDKGEIPHRNGQNGNGNGHKPDTQEPPAPRKVYR